MCHVILRALVDESKDNDEGKFNHSVFWVLCIFLFVSLLSVYAYCSCSDSQVSNEAGKAKDTPEQRKETLAASFERNQVRMVRAETSTPSDCRTLHVRSFCSHAALRICFALVLSLFCLFLGGQGRGLDG